MRPVVALAVLLLAGCAAPAVPPQDGAASPPSLASRPPSALGETLAFEAKAPDGVALRGHVHLPEGDGPFSTILVYSPYWNGGGDEPSDGVVVEKDGRRTIAGFDDFLTPLMDAGFAVALVNLRGTGLSDGCYSYMNHPANGPDANAVVDAIAAEPWSDGDVGMYGISYMGAVQYAALASGPSPHLKAVVPVSGEWDEWNLLGRWGAAVNGASVHPFNRALQQGLAVFGLLEQKPPTAAHWCPATVEEGAAWSQMSTVGDKDAFLRERDLRWGLANSTVPVFATNGLLTDGEGHILQFEGLWDILPGDKRLRVGQWPHHFPSEDAEAFGREAAQWFDHYLRGGPATMPAGVVEYEDDAGTWHTADRWPPAGVDATLHLSTGTLEADASHVAASDARFASSDAFPEPALACGPNALAYVSPPLAEDVVVAGNVFANLTLASTLPDGNLVVALWRQKDAHACPGAADVDATLVGYAASDLYHRGHLEVGRDFPLNADEVVALRSMPLAARLPAGERLVLVVGGGAPFLHPDTDKPAITVRTGDGREGSLLLRVVEGELRFGD